MFNNRQTLLIFGDIFILALSFGLMVLIRFDLHSQSSFIALQARSFAFLFMIWLIIFFVFDLYSLRRVNPNPRNIGFLIMAILTNTILSVFAFYIFSTGATPKTNLAIITSIAFVLLVVWRRLFYVLFTARFTRSIALIGTSTHLQELGEEISHHPHLGNVVALWNTTTTYAETTQTPVDLIITETAPADVLLSFSQQLNTESLTLTAAYQQLFAKVPVELMTNEKALEIITHEDNQGVAVVYRLIEIIVASIVLIITSPFLLLAVIAILIEDGSPLFYKQNRIGKNSKIFSIYKLRSMKKDAERNGIQWADHKDTRITRVGAILRKTHLDEVPQMINIIKGDIALVGPRPERPELVASLEQEIPYYYLRHVIKPGFTGWAQIKFRYARTVLDSKEKFEYDLYYLMNKNPILDSGIVLKTIQIIFTH